MRIPKHSLKVEIDQVLPEKFEVKDKLYHFQISSKMIKQRENLMKTKHFAPKNCFVHFETFQYQEKSSQKCQLVALDCFLDKIFRNH